MIQSPLIGHDQGRFQDPSSAGNIGQWLGISLHFLLIPIRRGFDPWRIGVRRPPARATWCASQGRGCTRPANEGAKNLPWSVTIKEDWYYSEAGREGGGDCILGLDFLRLRNETIIAIKDENFSIYPCFKNISSTII
jgi:hypothetical protein